MSRPPEKASTTRLILSAMLFVSFAILWARPWRAPCHHDPAVQARYRICGIASFTIPIEEWQAMKKYSDCAPPALLAGTAALAQTAPVARRHRPAPPAADGAPDGRQGHDPRRNGGDGPRAFRAARHQPGRLPDHGRSRAQAAQMGRTSRKEMGGTLARRPTGDPNAAFDRLDTNKDGSISRDEFAKGHEQRDRAPRRDPQATAGRRQGRQGSPVAWHAQWAAWAAGCS